MHAIMKEILLRIIDYLFSKYIIYFMIKLKKLTIVLEREGNLKEINKYI